MNLSKPSINNLELMTRASKVIPGGVNSPVRAFNAVGGSPVFMNHGKSAYLFSESGEKYIDYVGSWGPLILGHCDSDVITKLKEVMDSGLSFGAPTVLEIELAEKVVELMPNIEKIRMVNSGTEATMSALRLARGYTKKNKIIKFVGCYHGHHDSLLVKSGSGLLTFDQTNDASSEGVSKAAVADTLLANFNDLASVAQLFKNYPDDVAAVILEPVPGNMNMILPQPEFLQGLRDLCTKHKTVLIFDEVMSGFRVALGGAQEVYGVKPDLTALGKVIGGGMPVGAFGGRAEIMNLLSPLGKVYQAGTLSGNPLAMAAGLVTLNKISKPGFFDALATKTELLVNGIREVMSKHKIPFMTNNLGGMFGLFFTEGDQTNIHNFADATACNTHYFNKFFHAMLTEGVYLAPSAFEAGFVSSAHTEADIDFTVRAVDKAILAINNQN